MPLQLALLDGVRVIVDSSAPAVPLVALSAEGGTAVASTMARLRELALAALTEEELAGTARAYSAAQWAGTVALAPGNPTTWDLRAAQVARLTLNAHRTAEAVNHADGLPALLVVVQDGTGGWSLTLGDGFSTANGEPPTIDPAPHAITVLACICEDGQAIVMQGGGGGSEPAGDPDHATIGPASTLVVDLAGAPYQSVTLTGTTTIGTANRPPSGKARRVLLTAFAGDAERSISFAEGISIFGSDSAVIPADEAAWLDIVATGPANANVRVNFGLSAGAIEPPPPDELSPEVEAYVDAINLLRSGPLGETQIEHLEEFWQRIGNRDSELSGNLQSALADLFVLRSAYNAGQGSKLLGLKLTELDRVGADTHAWGTSGITFDGDQKFLGSDPIITGTGAWTAFVVAQDHEGSPSNSRAIFSQALAPSDGQRTQFAARFASGRPATAPFHGGSVYSVDDPDAVGYYAGAPKLVCSVVNAATSRVALHRMTAPTGSVSRSDLPGGYTVSGEAVAIGGRADSAATAHWIGTLTLCLLFAGDRESQREAIATILRETLLSGVSA